MSVVKRLSESFSIGPSQDEELASAGEIKVSILYEDPKEPHITVQQGNGKQVTLCVSDLVALFQASMQRINAPTGYATGGVVTLGDVGVIGEGAPVGDFPGSGKADKNFISAKRETALDQTTTGRIELVIENKTDGSPVTEAIRKIVGEEAAGKKPSLFEKAFPSSRAPLNLRLPEQMAPKAEPKAKPVEVQPVVVQRRRWMKGVKLKARDLGNGILLLPSGYRYEMGDKSKRVRDVAMYRTLWAEGLSVDEIAFHLHIRPAWVRQFMAEQQIGDLGSFEQTTGGISSYGRD